MMNNENKTRGNLVILYRIEKIKHKDTKVKVYLHADDFGLTKKTTDDILECIDAGVINSVSIMANGYAFEYAAEQLLIRKSLNINLVLHINLDQCMALSGISLLTDEQGQLNQRFEKLLLSNFFSTAKLKCQLKEAVMREIEMQIKKTLPLFDALAKVLKIDSERCSHFVPLVFESIMSLSDRYPIRSIRFFDMPFSSILVKFYRFLFSQGYIKYFLLQSLGLSFSYIKKATQASIGYPTYTFTVIHGSRLNYKLVDQFVSAAQNKNAESIEIVFHPFKASPDELHFWEGNRLYWRYFNFKNQGSEKEDLIKHKDYYQKIIKQYQ